MDFHFTKNPLHSFKTIRLQGDNIIQIIRLDLNEMVFRNKFGYFCIWSSYIWDSQKNFHSMCLLHFTIGK